MISTAHDVVGSAGILPGYSAYIDSYKVGVVRGYITELFI
jgi:hypothetical protein